MTTRLRGRIATAFLAVSIGCAEEPPDDHAVSAHAAPLTGATKDGAHPEVVAIVKRRHACDTKFVESFCTGALIAKGVVLTAAHCALAEPALDVEVFAGADVNQSGGRFHGVVAQLVHPGYDPESFTNDLALLWLDEPMTATPLVRGPDPAVGDIVTMVGYGGDENGGGGERRVGTSRVTAVDAQATRTEASPALACGGDSGGPALKDGKLVGVVRSGDPTCASFANLTRLDGAWGTFVEPALATPPKRRRRVTATEPLCVERCVDDVDCPAGMLCLPERELGNHCGYATLRSGAFGETCTSNDACASHDCAQVGAGDQDRECRCFTSCRDLPPVVVARPTELEGGCAVGPTTPDLVAISGLLFAWATARRARRRTRARLPL